MSRVHFCVYLLLASLALVTPMTAAAPVRPRVQPRLEAVAETKLLMEGLNQANFRGLERHLRKKPADAETWTFIRGQALLIAETGNLLLLRPPKSDGQDAWMEHSMNLRQAASELARTAGNRDYDRSLARLAGLANACNTCHQAFAVKMRLNPFAEVEENAIPRTNRTSGERD